MENCKPIEKTFLEIVKCLYQFNASKNPEDVPQSVGTTIISINSIKSNIGSVLSYGRKPRLLYEI